MALERLRGSATGIGFAGLLGLISYLASDFLPIPPGMGSIKLVGTVAAMAGTGIAIVLSDSLRKIRGALLILCALGIFVLSFALYLTFAYGPPGKAAELMLYVCTCGIFVPIGLLAFVAKVKLVG